MKICVSANFRIQAKLAKAGDHCGNNWPTNLPAASSSTSRLQLCHAVTLSTALINNMLTLGRKRLDSIFSNSWEVRRRREELSRSQLTVTLPALTQHMTDVTLDGCHQICMKVEIVWYLTFDMCEL